MKILTDKQIKEADQYTIANESINSIDLMERASIALSAEVNKLVGKDSPLIFVIGKGNNGGDGLAMARLLSLQGYQCFVYCVFTKENSSGDNVQNLLRLPENIRRLSKDFIVPEDAVIVDAILGSGVRGEISEPIRSVIDKINNLPNQVISIDLPSGMSTEWNHEKSTIIKADYTLTIEFPKLGMLLPDVGELCGEIIIVPIGLSEEFLSEATTNYHFNDENSIRSLLDSIRSKFAHKGIYGHTLLVCGSERMSGAATLATGSALRSGCGLVTTHLPYSERSGIQMNCPSAMLSFDENEYFSQLPDNLDKYKSIAVGCGLGQSDETVNALERLMKSVSVPMVLDADALNIIASHRRMKDLIPEGSILTPHVGELRRLIGGWESEADKLEKVTRFASIYKSVAVVKGAYSAVCCPDGKIYFNSTGNAGMAKAGSGDVLTGLLGGLLARGYCSEKAAQIGVYLHGLAGDLAASELGQEAMNSRDIIDYIPKAFMQLAK